LVPFPLDELAPLPEGLETTVWDGLGDPPTDLGDVDFYTPRYLGRRPTLELIHDLPSLRVLQVLTAGVDNLRPYLRDGITLCNAKGLHDASTAELTVALMLASLRDLPDFVRAQDAGEWSFRFTQALADRTVLIVGYGAVGAAIERRLAGFECSVLRVARSARDGVAGMDELPQLLPKADVVVLIVPMTDETQGMADAKFLAQMKDGALLVNVARGPVADTDALLAELSSGRLKAAVDVTDPEPLPADHPLWKAPGLIVSPHVGGASSAFHPRAVRLVRDQLHRFAAGDPLANIVTGAY
jgi:phosphoglycerate dehydrogenase-like enzyme